MARSDLVLSMKSAARMAAPFFADKEVRKETAPV
jgi:hypothetical protein